jgi:hypothetical protein
MIKASLKFMLLMLILCSSCKKDNQITTEGADPGLSDLEDPSILADTFDANFYQVNFDANQQGKIEKAIVIIKLVVATEEFRTRILNHTYNGSKTFVDNQGYTNAQIYQRILEAAENLQPARNNIMDAEIELYTDNSNIVGYTYPTSKKIWVNTKYFNSYTAAGVAHNLFHEWMHKLGFDHATSWSASRDYSVPYALGLIVGSIGKDFL